MIKVISGMLIYLFELLVCLMFNENFYRHRRKATLCFAVYAASFIIQYAVSYISMPMINLVSFIICNFLIALICYESKVKTCFFTTVMLTFFMFFTELIFLYLLSYIYNIELTSYDTSFLVYITSASLSKLLFFVVVFILSKLMRREENASTDNKFAIILCFLPVTTIVIFFVLNYWGRKTEDVSPFNIAVSFCSILLLFANFLVFYVYERVQKTNAEITRLKLEKQRGEISAEYYKLLSEEYENSRILIHDIKNHLNYVEDKILVNEYKEALKYVTSIKEDFGLDKRIKYSGNGLIDVIVNRYAKKCRTAGINFEVEACCSRLEFMAESDITSLLGNLFDNAFEAAVNSEEKEIVFSIYVRNADFIVVSLINSCETHPRVSDGKLISVKKNAKEHGYGTKSIKRVVNKYEGDFSWEFNEEAKRFRAEIVLSKK